MPAFCRRESYRLTLRYGLLLKDASAARYPHTQLQAGERQRLIQGEAKRGGDSAWYWMDKTGARPKNGRPLQNLSPTTHGGFVAAVPSRAFRDGTGIFIVKLNHYAKRSPLWNHLCIHSAYSLSRNDPWLQGNARYGRCLEAHEVDTISGSRSVPFTLAGRNVHGCSGFADSHPATWSEGSGFRVEIEPDSVCIQKWPAKIHVLSLEFAR